MKIANLSSGDYTVVPGTDLTLVGTAGESLSLAVNEGTGSQCWGQGTHSSGISGIGPDYTVAPNETLTLPATFCFATSGSFTPVNLQVQGNTPQTYTIDLGN